MAMPRFKPSNKLGIHSCYDAEQCFDRYTVFFNGYGTTTPGTKSRLFLALSPNPDSPQGVSQHGEAEPGNHCGTPIDFEDLPQRCQDYLNNYFKTRFKENNVETN
jgi:hypothetical protein